VSAPPVEIALPFTGRWLAMNSPARRVPSHGVDLFGQRYAIDFVGVDDRHRDAERSDWRTVLLTEPPERFYSFGRPVLAPADGVVVTVHDGEPDHEARRSQPALAQYALGQAARVRRGAAAVAGNHVVLALRESGAFAGLVHLRHGSLRVAVGDTVATGQQLGQCGNSGNSTQPHVHVQLMDSVDLAVARGVPVVFRGYREWHRGTGHPTLVDAGIPGERSVVEPIYVGHTCRTA
jgi:hypothetical protein